MATKPLAPTNNLAARIDRLANRNLFTQPKQVVENRILVHRCFSQQDGKPKPDWCPCKDRVAYSDALAMIARGEAGWLLIRNPKTTGLVPFHRAVVIKASKAAVEKANKQRTQGIRLKKHFGYEANIFCDFRKFIQKHFAAGTLPQTALNHCSLPQGCVFRER